MTSNSGIYYDITIAVQIYKRRKLQGGPTDASAIVLSNVITKLSLFFPFPYYLARAAG